MIKNYTYTSKSINSNRHKQRYRITTRETKKWEHNLKNMFRSQGI